MSSLLLISGDMAFSCGERVKAAIKVRVSAFGFSSLTQCRASRGNKISREMVSMVASLALRRRGGYSWV